MKPKVYLSGPIAGQTYSEATDWRVAMRDLLGMSIDAMSPMRGKEALSMHTSPIEHRVGYKYIPELQGKGIVTRDRNDVMTCDLMLVYLPTGSDRVSIGTMIEYGWADAWRKPIITVIEYPNPHKHIFVMEMSGWVLETLEQAADMTRKLLLP